MTTRVLFLAPTILPGSGGVADYCLHLSAALTAQGIECHLASWNESPAQVGAFSNEERGRLFLQETPATDHRAKAVRLRSYLDEHEIEWVSLQFVCFGFGMRGLIPGLALALAKAFEGRHCHLFFHELWIGDHRGARWRDRLLGQLQKRQILRLIATLQPAAVWTNIDLYGRQLAAEGVNARVAPVFGTIPFSEERADDWILPQLRNQPAKERRSEYLLVGLFGSLVSGWPYRQVLPLLVAFAGQRKIALILFGRNGEVGTFCEYANSLPQTEVLSLGPLDPETVNRVMNSMDVALAVTPAEVIFKSSSAVAFLERGVPTVAVHRGLERPKRPATAAHPALILTGDDLGERLAAFGNTRRVEPILPQIAPLYYELFTAGRN